MTQAQFIAGRAIQKSISILRFAYLVAISESFVFVFLEKCRKKINENSKWKQAQTVHSSSLKGMNATQQQQKQQEQATAKWTWLQHYCCLRPFGSPRSRKKNKRNMLMCNRKFGANANPFVSLCWATGCDTCNYYYINRRQRQQNRIISFLFPGQKRSTICSTHSCSDSRVEIANANTDTPNLIPSEHTKVKIKFQNKNNHFHFFSVETIFQHQLLRATHTHQPSQWAAVFVGKTCLLLN